MKYILKYFSVIFAISLLYITEVNNNKLSSAYTFSLVQYSQAQAESSRGFSKVECLEKDGTVYGICSGSDILSCECDL